MHVASILHGAIKDSAKTKSDGEADGRPALYSTGHADVVMSLG